MSRLRLLSAAALLAVAANSHATSFIVTTDAVVNALKATSDATTNVVSSSFKDNKIVREARDDAASFVASEGAIAAREWKHLISDSWRDPCAWK